MSPALLDSDAATKEWAYAWRLGKPLLPVLVAPLPMHLLPPELAALHIVDYTTITPITAFQLAGAIADLPPAPPLPHPPPEPPSAPLSYLAELAQGPNARPAV